MSILRETVRQSLKLVVRQPGRSALTMLGLAIGVGAFIAMVSFGEGARRSVLAQFEVLGANLLKVQVRVARNEAGAAPPAIGDTEVSLLTREAVTVAEVLPVRRRVAGVSAGGTPLSTTIYGVPTSFLRVHSWQVAEGGPFDSSDVEQRAKVCVLGSTPARVLFGEEDPLGGTVTLAGTTPCRVIGVLAQKGYSTSGADLDDLVVMPLSTFEMHVADRAGYTYLELEPASPALVDAAMAESREILRRARRLDRDDQDDFTVSSPLEVIRAADSTARILSTLLAAIAAVSLLVGGIGIMNIQLVSVAERTREIGTRAAIGASPRQILAQFLIEALVLTLLGTFVGIAVGVGVAVGVASTMQWPRVISTEGILLSSAFGVFVGVAFGYLPARRAALLDPIEALRHE